MTDREQCCTVLQVTPPGLGQRGESKYVERSSRAFVRNRWRDCVLRMFYFLFYSFFIVSKILLMWQKVAEESVTLVCFMDHWQRIILNPTEP